MKRTKKVLPKTDRGLSPMVATIVLIAMVMVIAGVLAAGLSGGTQNEPRQAGMSIEGLEPGSDHVKIHMKSGDILKDSFDMDSDDNIVWRNLELRVAGENVEADVAKATEAGIHKQGPENQLDLQAGDLLELENMVPQLKSGDEVTLVWTPNDQILFTEEV